MPDWRARENQKFIQPVKQRENGNFDTNQRLIGFGVIKEECEQFMNAPPQIMIETSISDIRQSSNQVIPTLKTENAKNVTSFSAISVNHLSDKLRDRLLQSPHINSPSIMYRDEQVG